MGRVFLRRRLLDRSQNHKQIWILTWKHSGGGNIVIKLPAAGGGGNSPPDTGWQPGTIKYYGYIWQFIKRKIMMHKKLFSVSVTLLTLDNITRWDQRKICKIINKDRYCNYKKNVFLNKPSNRNEKKKKNRLLHLPFYAL